MKDLSTLLEISSRDHSHLCPRQILGVRIGLKGICSLEIEPNHDSKRLLVIVETDGCFVDGIIAATGCTVGHRTLRVEDYGKVAAVFIDTSTNQCLRVAPALDIRQRPHAYAADKPDHYYAQMKAYQTMPDEEMMTVQEVCLNTPVEQVISHPGRRVNCDMCGEEVMNEREVRKNGHSLCHTCAHGGYYQSVQNRILSIPKVAAL